ncbi:MAG TPA: hypothetical protein VGP93_00265, partial [Polyangiaceae bacterium]|nr:hypothetical protein [Polyangiaceae bacterium]
MPKPCEPYARDALECARSAKDLQCANIAPESCSKLYRRTAECLRAPDSFQVATEDAAKALPSGWERYQDQSG